jgi:hypothetical protein
MSKFERQLFDLGIAPVNFRGAGLGLFQQTANPIFDPGQQFW